MSLSSPYRHWPFLQTKLCITFSKFLHLNFSKSYTSLSCSLDVDGVVNLEEELLRLDDDVGGGEVDRGGFGKGGKSLGL